jgi:hypothetical protein
MELSILPIQLSSIVLDLAVIPCSKQLIERREGHLVEYRNPYPQKHNFILTVNVGKQMVDYYMHDSRFQLGLTKETTVQSNPGEDAAGKPRAVLQKFGLMIASIINICNV